MGTVAYMSPEQARGEEVDHRTDIWSLGAMLYEMLSGERPFKKTQEHSLLLEILNESSPSITSLRADIPNHIEQLVRKALAKKVSERYQKIGELINDLKESQPIAFPKSEKSIVVLPFDDLSPERDQEYFSDGLTEEVISDLSGISSLRVISRSSAMTFKGTKKTAPEIAKQLNVQYVLEGSVRKAGNNLRITAQLIDAAKDTHLWAEKYRGTLDDVFDIQEKVSRSIADALKLKLSPEENRRISERHIENVPAYELYLKASAEIFKFNEKAINRAIGYLQNALSIIGDNALLFSGLAFAHWNLINIGAKQEEYLVKAEEYVKKALAMDPEFPQAHVVLGWIYCIGEPLKSIYHLKKALEITPDDSMALAALAVDYMCVGKISIAALISERLLEIDPLDFPPYYVMGALHFYSGQYDKALKAWRKLYKMYPESAYSKWSYALILTYNNQHDEAFSIIDQSAKTDPGNVLTKLGLMLKYGLQGEKDKVFQEMTPDFKKTCQRDYSFSHHNPLLENIRGEPRFKKLMERVKHEWENVEV